MKQLVVAAAIVVDGRVLAARRSAPVALAGRWEFPGGKVEAGEDGAAAIIRECAEELGVVVRPIRELGVASGRVELRLWLVELVVGTPAILADHDALRWLGPGELDDVRWLPIDLDLLECVRPLLHDGSAGESRHELPDVPSAPVALQTVTFSSGGDRCEGWYLRAAHDGLAGRRGRPCVVMAHGFGATRDAGLLPFAERFAQAGLDVLVFDYRGFGTSTGAPRQDVNHRRHRQDYHAAIGWARSQDGIDLARIVVWGSSYSGGHVVAVAARDPMIAAVISQGAAVDGFAALRLVATTSGLGKVLALTRDGLRDAARALTRRPPYLVPVVGEPGSAAVIVSPGSAQGYQAIMGPTFRNEMCARGILRLIANRPVAVAGDLACPALFIIAEQDNVAPPQAVHEAARRSGAEVLSLDCGHFEIYGGEAFEASVSRQVEFLVRHLSA
jgi:mutator protein MutT